MTSDNFPAFRVSAFQRFSVPLLVLGALAVRLPLLGYSFYGDEAFTVLRDTHRLITDTEDRFRPLFFSLVYLWKQLGFHGEAGLRLLPLLLGVAQVPFAFLIGRRLGGRSLGLTFATLVAFSPMLIEFSQELRMYSMIALIALLQVWILLLLLGRSSPGRWIAFAAVGVIGVYTHLHYWLFLAGMALTFVRERRALPWWQGLAALGTVALFYVPNYGNILAFIERRGGEYAMHLSSALPKLIAAFTVGFNYFRFPEQGVGRAVGTSEIALNLPLALLAAIPALVILWRILWLHRNGRADGSVHTGFSAGRIVMLCHELLTVPVVLAFVASLVTGKYWLQPKYLIFSTPVALLLIALAFLSIRTVLLRRLTGLLAFVVFVVALVHYWNPQDYGRRENWRGAAQMLREALDADSRLLLVPGSYRLLSYYAPELDSRWETVTPPQTPALAAAFEADVRARLTGAGDVYYLRYDVAQNISDPRDLLPMALDNIAAPAGALRFNPRFHLYRWRITNGM